MIKIVNEFAGSKFKLAKWVTRKQIERSVEE
jgi:hypothetical protein